MEYSLTCFCRLYTTLMANEEWLSDIHAADAIFIATHSQGSIVSTHLLDRLLKGGHIITVNSTTTAGVAVDGVSLAEGGMPFRKPQKVCCLALCGIHLGPLRYLSTSSLLQPYIQVREVCRTSSTRFDLPTSISNRRPLGNCSIFR